MADQSVDSFYQLKYSTDGTAYKKVPKLQNADPPPRKKTLDEVTATDDHVKVEEPVDFYEGGEIKAEIAYIESDPDHVALKAAYDAGTELNWQYIFTQAPSLSQQFKGRISDWTPKTDTKKKLRIEMAITITTQPTNVTVV